MNNLRFILQRLVILPLVALGNHAIGFGYALLALQVQRSQNPWGYGGSGSVDIFTIYLSRLERLFNLDFGTMPGGTVSIQDTVLQALINSLGLFLLALLLSSISGLAIGFLASKINPAKVANWLAPISTIGLATPSFFISTLFIVATVYYLSIFGENAPALLPLSGFGWDEHLVLPILALSIRPFAQIAQSTATLLTGEFLKQYIVTSRAVGNNWNRIRRKHALSNVLSPILINLSGTYRFLLAELILVEWIFNWPGLGRLLALTLIPPSTFTLSGFGNVSIYFLYPDLLAIIMAFFAVLFFVIDSIFTGISRRVDPRIHKAEEIQNYG